MIDLEDIKQELAEFIAEEFVDVEKGREIAKHQRKELFDKILTAIEDFIQTEKDEIAAEKHYNEYTLGYEESQDDYNIR